MSIREWDLVFRPPRSRSASRDPLFMVQTC